MIDLKKWKKYRSMLGLMNEMAQKRALEMSIQDMEKQVELIKRFPSYMPTMPFCPAKTRKPLMEDFLNWMADGEPTLAKKLKVAEAA